MDHSMDQLYKTGGGEIMTCRSCQQVGPNGPNDVGMGRNAATYPDISTINIQKSAWL